MTASGPDVAARIASEVRAAGGRALIVGGWVRDRLLGHPSKDIDIEVFGVDADALRALLEPFGRVNTVGESFHRLQGGRPRCLAAETRIQDRPGAQGFVVTGDPRLSPREAARRRDFTINAIYWDPLTGEYLDPFDGRADLDRRLLRAVDPRTFPRTACGCSARSSSPRASSSRSTPTTRATLPYIPLDDLPAERIWGEIEKLLLRAAQPSIGFALALELGVVERLFPELDALVGCPQEPEWHPEGDVWVHTLLVIDQARARLDGLALSRLR